MKRSMPLPSFYASLVAIAFTSVFVFLLWFFIRRAPLAHDEIMVGQIQKIASLLKKIDNECGIIGFEDEGGSRKKCYIDFLTIKSFIGSEAGSVNLLHPEKWQGPYIEDNPTIQEHYYYVIKIKDTYYIVPGDGVKLSNGKVIGKDIIIDSNSDIEKMMTDPKELNFKGSPLAAKLELNKQKTPVTKELATSAGAVR